MTHRLSRLDGYIDTTYTFPQKIHHQPSCVVFLDVAVETAAGPRPLGDCGCIPAMHAGPTPFWHLQQPTCR